MPSNWRVREKGNWGGNFSWRWRGTGKNRVEQNDRYKSIPGGTSTPETVRGLRGGEGQARAKMWNEGLKSGLGDKNPQGRGT